MIKLSIIIPHHKENETVTNALFSSLNAQIGIDWKEIEIIVVNDTDDEYMLDYSNYTLIKDKIQNVISPYKNSPGMARQYGIDICKGKYIIFCDIDDCLFSVLSLYEILKAIQDNPKADLISYDMMEQHPQGFNEFRLSGDAARIWVYSRIYKKKYLEDNDIRFHPNIRFSEDLYFSRIVDTISKNKIKAKIVVYVRRRANNFSVTRSPELNYVPTGLIKDHILASVESFKFFTDHNFEYTGVEQDISTLITYYYVLYHRVYVKQFRGSEYKKYRKEAEEVIAKFVKEWDPELKIYKKHASTKFLLEKMKQEGVTHDMLKKPLEKFYADILAEN